MDNVRKLPLWKGTVENILARYKVGDTIPHSWLQEDLEIDYSAAKNPEDYRDLGIAYMSALDGIRKELLESHNVLIDNVRGEGYRWMHPKEQAEHAMNTGKKAIRDALRRSVSYVVNTDHNQLTQEEQRESRDALTSMQGLKYAMNMALKKPDHFKMLTESKK